jgi:hypothetical protein
MSQAFVRESDEQWLHEVQPTLNALIVYLTRENNNVRVYEQKSFINKEGKEVHAMGYPMQKIKKANGISSGNFYPLLSLSQSNYFQRKIKI